MQLRFALIPARAMFAMAIISVLLLRALVPTGYMADRTQSGSITVTICGSDGVFLIPLEKDQSSHDNEEQRADAPCTASSFAKAMGAPPQPLVLSTNIQRITAYEARNAPFCLAARARAMPPARGPPITV